MTVVAGTAMPGAAQESMQPGAPAGSGSNAGSWRRFATGFASSILAHEGAHIVVAYALGGRASFGLDAGRPTVYSGIDAQRDPRRQFAFSSAGLTVQTLLDEIIIDAPHDSARLAGAFERGMLAGGIATAFFYVTIGRSGSVSDIDYMARTSSLSKTTISLLYGGVAAVHLWRLSRNDRYTEFFARPGPNGGMRVGLEIQGR